MLARVELSKAGSEKRTFECSKCDFVQTIFADDPLRSDAVRRLISSVRPPS
jgi:hypothetical protein